MVTVSVNFPFTFEGENLKIVSTSRPYIISLFKPAFKLVIAKNCYINHFFSFPPGKLHRLSLECIVFFNRTHLVSFPGGTGMPLITERRRSYFHACLFHIVRFISLEMEGVHSV
jgi:hypothetical protein